MKELATDRDTPPPPPPSNSSSIISSLLRTELNMHVKQQAWDKIEQLLKSDPHVTRAVDPATGELPLHVLARSSEVPTLPVDLAILAHPHALLHRGQEGQLPIHAAAATGSPEILKIIYDAYKEGRKVFDGSGRLPIHVAAESKSVAAVQFFLDEDPASASSVIQKPKEASEEEFLGGMPIHCACRSGASSEILDMLLRSKSGGAYAKLRDFQGNLPIHLLLKHGSSVDFDSIKALLSAYSSSLKKKDSDGDSPLVIALKHRIKSDIIGYLFEGHPEAAEVISGDGRSPLVIAIAENCSDDTIQLLLDQAPVFVSSIDEKTRLLPIEIATNQRRSLQLIHYLLLADLPIDLTDRTPAASSSYRSSYQHSWEHVVAIDEYSEVVSNLLQSCTHAQRIALAKVPCRLTQKPLLEVAAPKSKQALIVGMRLFGIIELTDIAPAFATDRTQIYYGLKYPENSADGVSVVFEEEGATLTDPSEAAKPVIVKLTSHRELMERELSIRRDYQLSPHFVPQIYSVHHSEEPSSSVAGASPTEESSPSYCISMEQGLTLENIWLEMKSKDTNTRIPMEDIKQIAAALLHLHEKGLVHGDIGSHNVGKFDDGRYKLLSIGGTVPVGQATNPDRAWYFPPEAINSTKKSKLKLKSKPKLVSITASPALDLWGFGVLAYQLLCGVPLPLYVLSPDRSANIATVRSWNEKALGKALANLRLEDETAADLLSGLLHPKPSRRFASVKEVLDHKFFSVVGQEIERGDTDISLPPPTPPSPEQTPELDEFGLNVPILKNPKDVVYPTQERRLQAADSADDKESDDSANGKEVTTSSDAFDPSSLNPEKITSFSFPVQDLRWNSDPNSDPFSYPVQERRTNFPVQEKNVATTAASNSATTSKDTSVDHQSVSSSLLESQSVQRFDGDCFSTASTKFADNTSSTFGSNKHEVPVQVVATEKKPRRHSSGSRSGGEQGTDSQTNNVEDDVPPPIDTFNSIDSDEESEPGRIIPGSRLKKRTTAQKYHDPQLV